MASDVEVLGIFEKMATLKERKAKSKDLLRPLIDLSLGIFIGFPPVRLCIVYVFCQYTFASILSFSYLLIKFDQQTLLKFGSYSGIQVFVLINLGPLIFMADSIHDFLKKYGKAVLPIEMLKDDTLKQVRFAMKMILVICFFNICFAFIAAMGFINAPKYFDKRTYLCVWIKENFPQEISKWMVYVVHWSSLPVALVLAGSPVGWAYGSCKAIFQIMTIHEVIDGISDSSLPQKLRHDSELYQEAVRQKMIIAIMVHEYTVKFQTLASEILEAPMMLLACGSLVLGASLMMEVLSNQDRNYGELWMYVGIFSFALAGIISSNLYLILGQALKDESEKCNYRLSQLPWYDMNEKNKKIYSIFLHRSSKNLAVSNSIVRVDYVLLVKIIKSLYSLAAVLSRFVAVDEDIII